MVKRSDTRGDNYAQGPHYDFVVIVPAQHRLRSHVRWSAAVANGHLPRLKKLGQSEVGWSLLMPYNKRRESRVHIVGMARLRLMLRTYTVMYLRRGAAKRRSHFWRGPEEIPMRFSESNENKNIFSYYILSYFIAYSQFFQSWIWKMYVFSSKIKLVIGRRMSKTMHYYQ